MRILFDSKQSCFKDPFGTLTPRQNCALCIHVPASVGATRVSCVICREDRTPIGEVTLDLCEKQDAYELFRGSFCRKHPWRLRLD